MPPDECAASRLVLEKDRFTILDDVLYFVDAGPQHRLRVAVLKSLRRQLMEKNHSGPVGGHFAPKGPSGVLMQRYSWDGMVTEIHQFYRSCLTCAAYRGAGRRCKPLLHPIPVAVLFVMVGVDILEMPATLQGNRYIVVFVEYLTKWVEAFPVEDQTSETITRLLIGNVVCRYGVPSQLLSDGGPNLLSDLIAEVCELLGMKKVNTNLTVQ